MGGGSGAQRGAGDSGSGAKSSRYRGGKAASGAAGRSRRKVCSCSTCWEHSARRRPSGGSCGGETVCGTPGTPPQRHGCDGAQPRQPSGPEHANRAPCPVAPRWSRHTHGTPCPVAPQHHLSRRGNPLLTKPHIPSIPCLPSRSAPMALLWPHNLWRPPSKAPQQPRHTHGTPHSMAPRDTHHPMAPRSTPRPVPPRVPTLASSPSRCVLRSSSRKATSRRPCSRATFPGSCSNGRAEDRDRT